ncbi:MAG: OmpA family protein [Planctomycetes bacterium]|nr:OmpA family protein [Planctomycetota bacterium]
MGVDRLWIWVSLCILVILAGCVSKADYDRLDQVRQEQDRVIANLRNYNRELQMKHDRAVSSDPLKDERIVRLEKELEIYKEENEKLRAEMESRFARSDLPQGFTPEPWGIRAEGAALFDSGQHTLKASGQAALRQLAPSLQGLRIRVEGHTDTDPVRHTKERYPYGNLQLSGMRALEVANFLIRECKLDANNISFSGCGEYDPIAPNDTPANKAKNRRVDIRALQVLKESPRP